MHTIATEQIPDGSGICPLVCWPTAAKIYLLGQARSVHVSCFSSAGHHSYTLAQGFGCKHLHSDLYGARSTESSQIAGDDKKIPIDLTIIAGRKGLAKLLTKTLIAAVNENLQNFIPSRQKRD